MSVNEPPGVELRKLEYRIQRFEKDICDIIQKTNNKIAFFEKQLDALKEKRKSNPLFIKKLLEPYVKKFNNHLGKDGNDSKMVILEQVLEGVTNFTERDYLEWYDDHVGYEHFKEWSFSYWCNPLACGSCRKDLESEQNDSYCDSSEDDTNVEKKEHTFKLQRTTNGGIFYEGINPNLTIEDFDGKTVC